MKSNELKSRDGSRKSRYLNDNSSQKLPLKLDYVKIMLILESCKVGKNKAQNIMETISFLKETNFQNFFQTMKDGNAKHNLLLMEIIKIALVYLKEEHEKISK